MLKLKMRALIQQNSPIRQAKWSPPSPFEDQFGPRIAFCSGNQHVYFWSEKHGAESVEIPTSKCRLKHLMPNNDYRQFFCVKVAMASRWTSSCVVGSGNVLRRIFSGRNVYLN